MIIFFLSKSWYILIEKRRNNPWQEKQAINCSENLLGEDKWVQVNIKRTSEKLSTFKITHTKLSLATSVFFFSSSLSFYNRFHIFSLFQLIRASMIFGTCEVCRKCFLSFLFNELGKSFLFLKFIMKQFIYYKLTLILKPLFEAFRKLTHRETGNRMRL